jgi:hypothetical protein
MPRGRAELVNRCLPLGGIDRFRQLGENELRLAMRRIVSAQTHEKDADPGSALGESERELENAVSTARAVMNPRRWQPLNGWPPNHHVDGSSDTAAA